MSGRRQFLQSATSSLAALAALGVVPNAEPASATDEWDLKWPTRLTGKRRAIFDVAEIESGFGVYRSAVWAAQSVDVLGAAPADVSPVIVLRAHAVIFALQQSFWDKFGVGRLRHVTHPVTLKETARNPVLMDESDGLPPPLVSGTLPKQLARGVTVLACNLALQAWIDAIRERERLSEAEARKQAVAALVPGVILQPSGVLAAILAQEHGCAYIRAS
jgi:intracellular sulfur oxidation DsrE/DsrF family protein